MTSLEIKTRLKNIVKERRRGEKTVGGWNGSISSSSSSKARLLYLRSPEHISTATLEDSTAFSIAKVSSFGLVRRLFLFFFSTKYDYLLQFFFTLSPTFFFFWLKLSFERYDTFFFSFFFFFFFFVLLCSLLEPVSCVKFDISFICLNLYIFYILILL